MVEFMLNFLLGDAGRVGMEQIGSSGHHGEAW
jgi:hypothetical protein